MSSTKVVKIDFFTGENLPAGLRETAGKQGIKLSGARIIAVKTHIASPPSYELVDVGTKPAEILGFMETLAKEDGADLGKAVQKAFRE